MIVGARHARDKQLSRAWRAPTVVVCFLIVVGAVAHADYQGGLDAYQRGDFERAIVEWQAVVESPPGTVSPAIRAETLYAVGMLFWLGQGVQQDTREAAEWLQLAADLNHAGAQTKLGFLYSQGQGVRQSNFEALKWFHAAANQGDVDAQYNLAVLYRDGLGVAPDIEESMKWFREAASNGDALSASIVAEYEQTGVLIKADGTTAVLIKADGTSAVHSTADAQDAPELPESMVEPSTQVVTEPKATAADKWIGKGEDWIREREPGHYTIQVIALSQSESLQRYIEQNPDWSPFAVYRQSRYQQPLWVLVQGDYPDVEAARQALRVFPEDMQARDKLWIRRFAMVQGLLE